MQVCTKVIREDRFDRLGEALEAVDAADEDVADAALLELGQHREPGKTTSRTTAARSTSSARRTIFLAHLRSTLTKL
jgi:hypothetical protein